MRRRRDPTAARSDEIWSAVERMLAGDGTATLELEAMIGSGFRVGRTLFTPIVERKTPQQRAAARVRGLSPADKVEKGQFAAITPERQIVLFGWRSQHDPRTRGWSERGYLSRYRIGDLAEYHGFNLDYFGPVLSISEKRVVIRRSMTSERSNASMTIAKFARRNWDPDNVRKGMKRNAEWKD